MQDSIGSTMSGVKVQSSQNNDKIGDATAMLLDLLSEYTQEVVRALYLKNEIKNIIDRVERDEYRQLLELRYISLLRWEDIADTMHFSLRWVYISHKRAIKYIEVHYIDMI